MAVPKHRTSKQKKRQRRSHLHLRANHFIVCKNCGTRKKPHVVCANCNFYRGEKVPVAVKRSKTK